MISLSRFHVWLGLRFGKNLVLPGARLVALAGSALAVCALLTTPLQAAYVSPANNRADFNFNYDWKFIKQDVSGASGVSFNDSAWQAVSLPHTWNNDKFREWCFTSNDTKQDPLLPSGTYYGLAWYRKHFTIDAAYAGRKVILEFQGIGRVANFYLNGVWVGLHENGVAPYGLDISTNAIFGGDNVIAVQVNNDENYKTVNYGGMGLPYGQPFNPNFGGLNRDVTLHLCDKLYQTLPLYRDLGTVGTYIYSTNLDTLNQTATVTIQTEVKNDYSTPRAVNCDAVVVDRDGNTVLSASLGQQTLTAGQKATFTTNVNMTGVHFWNPDYPYLYQVFTILSTNGLAVDVSQTPVGLRKFTFSNIYGLMVNGHPIYLKGYAPRCSMEWPCVGTPVDWMNELDFKLMKENNANFVRPMHIAPRKVQVEAADKFGIVMVCPAANNEGDETDPNKWQERLDIMRDVTIYFRNNPSVLFYEACNQILSAQHMADMKSVRLTWDPNGGRLAGLRSNDGNVTQTIREYSATMDGTGRQLYNPCWDAEYARGEAPRRVWDNYTPMLNPRWDGVNPATKYIKGGYFYIASDYHQALGLNSGNSDFIGDYLYVITKTNGNDHAYFRLQNSEDMVLENLAKYFARYAQSSFVQATNLGASSGVMVGGGKIIWSDSVTDGRMHDTEVTRVSGAIDGARLPKETFYGLQVAHNNNPQVYVVGHWNYPSNTVKTVYVAGNTPQVRLRTYTPGGTLITDYGYGMTNFFPTSILPLGGDQVNAYVFAFNNVAWQPGTITATGYSNGVAVATHSKQTTGPAVALRLTPLIGPAGQFRADGSDIAMFDCEVVDASGNRCPTYEESVNFTCSGEGTFLGGYNSGIRYSTNLRNLTNGYSLNVECGINRVFVRATRTAGAFTLTATSTNGLSLATASITSTGISVSSGLSTVWPQKYSVALGTEPAPVVEPPPTVRPALPQPPASATNIVNLAYSGSHPNAMVIQNAQAGMPVYMDSTVTLPALPAYLAGGEYIRAFQSDAGETSSTDQYQFDLTRYSYIYQVIDAANGMPVHDNNASYQWQQLPDTLNINGRPMNIFKSRLMAPYENGYFASNGHASSPFDPNSNLYLVFVVSVEQPLQSPTTPVTASSQQAGNTAGNAVDGNLGTRWSASSGTNPQWIKFDLGQNCGIGGYQMLWLYTNNIYQYLVEVSSDDVTYSTSLDMQLNNTPGWYEFRVPSTGANTGRYVRVTLISGGWASMFEMVINGITLTVPGTPTIVTALPANNQVTLKWTAAANATSYNIKRATDPGGPYTTISSFGSLTGTNYTDTTAYNGLRYYYVVSAVDNSVEGANSSEVNVLPTGPPLAPAGLVASAAVGSVSLSWQPVPGATATYNVKRSTSTRTEITITNVTATSYTDTAVVNETTYYYVVSAVTSYSEGTNSAEASATPYNPPVLQLRLPLSEAFTGSNYTTASDTNGGAANLRLTLRDATGNPADLHGAAGSGVGNFSQALDFSSLAAQGSGSTAPGASALGDPALGLGLLTKWNASIWFKPTRPLPGPLDGPVLFVLGANGTTSNGQTNSLALKLTGANQFSVWVSNATPVLFPAPTAFATNTWYFVAANFDAGYLKVYLGSDISAATLIGTTFIGARPVSFGAAGSLLLGNNNSDRARGFAGWLSDFRFYSGTVVPTVVASIQQAGLTVLIPPAPAGVTATPGDYQVSLSWNPASWASGYNIKRSTISGLETTLTAGTNVAATSFTDTTALNNTTYYYVVSGINTNGEGVNSLEASATPIPPPVAPTALTATPSGTQVANLQVALTWNASATATSYNLKRSTTSGTEATIATITGTSYTDTDLINGTLYYYVVSASNLSGEGASSSEASARPIVAPPAPAGLTAAAGFNQVGLSWAAAVGATSYNLKRSTTSGAEVTIASAAGTTYTDTSVGSGTNYYYVVSGVNSAGQGANSAEASGMPAAWVVAINCGSTTASGQFASDANYSAGTASTSGTAVTFANLINPAPANVYQSSRYGNFTYTVTNLPAGPYNVRLHFSENYWTVAGSRTFNTLINGTQVLTNFDIFAASGGKYVATIAQFSTPTNSNNTITIQFVSTKDNAQVNGIEILPSLPSLIPPPTPTGVSASPGNALVALTWTPSAGATSYNVKRSTTAGAEVTLTNVTAASYTDLNVVNSTTYYYVVTALGAAGESAASTEVSALPFMPVPAPAGPTGLTATPGGTQVANLQVSLAWNAVTNATSYNVKRATTPGAETTLATLPGTSYTDTNVVNGTLYYYVVSGSNLGGEGTNSAEASARPLVAPAAPVGLSATAGYTQIGLAWSAVAGAASYNVKRSTAPGAEVTISNVTTTGYPDANVTSGVNYYYVVAAVNSVGQGANSAEVSAMLLAGTTNTTPFKLRMPLNDAGSGNTTASDTSGGAANVALTMLDANGVATNYHGAPGSGPAGGSTRALDLSSGSFASSGPVATTNTSALAFGTVSTWTVSYWFKQSQAGSFSYPPRFFALGMDSSGTTDGGAANSIEMRLADASDFYVFPGVNNKVTVPYTQVANKWQFCALTYDGTALKVYFGSDTTSAALVCTSNLVNSGAVSFTGAPYLFLGNRADRTRSIAGWMSDFRFYTNAGNAAFVEGVRQANAPVPSAPASLTATGSVGQVALSWSPQPNAVSYNVKRSTSSGSEVMLANVASPGFADLNVGNATYYYVVTAVGAAGESAPSAEVSATPIIPLTSYQLWQIQYFGSTNNPLAAPSADACGTGQNNWFKYTAGLNPTSPASVFVLQLSAMNNGPILTFGPIASNRLYTVQTRTDLLFGNWSALTGAATTTNGNRISVTDTNAGLSPKYYRVGITLP